ncbi:MAG: branched-chain amino acid ABC transporter permease [Nitrospinota bacterium]
MTLFRAARERDSPETRVSREAGGRKTFHGVLLAILLVLVFLPPYLGLFWQTLLTEILVWGLFAMSFDLLYGYAGLLSFGQSVFFGMGVYGVALSIHWFDVGIWTALAAGWALALVFGWVIGFFAVRVGTAGFIILTALMSVVFHLIANNWQNVTGGDAGIPFTAPPLRLGLWTFSLTHPLTGYYFALSFVSLAFLTLRWLVGSKRGRVIEAIRENEDRATLLGYNVRRERFWAFVLAGFFAGIAGSLYSTAVDRFANQDFFHWFVSGDAVIWTLLGGAGTLVGPVLGTGILLVFKDYLSSWWPMGYPIVVGALMLAVVMFAPQGILGVARRRIRGRWKL